MRVQSAGEPPAVGHTVWHTEDMNRCSHCCHFSPDVILRPLERLGQPTVGIMRCNLCNAVFHLWDELRQGRDMPRLLRREIPEELRVACRVLVRRATFYLLSWRLRDSDEEDD